VPTCKICMFGIMFRIGNSFVCQNVMLSVVEWLYSQAMVGDKAKISP